MTTPQWTVDDLPDDLEADLRSALTMGLMLDDSDEAVDNVTIILNAIAPHLVAVVAAARLVDDMAAVVRRKLNGWKEDMAHETWTLPRRRHSPAVTEPMSPGEVAAFHHARHQEVT